MTPELFFAYLAGAIIGFSLLVITARSPVHSVLFMLLMFFHVAGLYLTLNAEFLAAIQVMVYAGAILVLFLFVVLLLNLTAEATLKRFVGPWPIGLAAAAALCCASVYALRSYVGTFRGTAGGALIKTETNTMALGTLLYTEFLYPFEIVSLVLLVALVGAIVLAKKKLRS
jgi:NADH-quinone oxidoreductase subunit J